MIDEMQDRAWVEHHERFSEDVRALFEMAGRALAPLFRRRARTAGKALAIPTAERERAGTSPMPEEGLHS